MPPGICLLSRQIQRMGIGENKWEFWREQTRTWSSDSFGLCSECHFALARCEVGKQSLANDFLHGNLSERWLHFKFWRWLWLVSLRHPIARYFYIYGVSPFYPTPTYPKNWVTSTGANCSIIPKILPPPQRSWSLKSPVTCLPYFGRFRVLIQLNGAISGKVPAVIKPKQAQARGKTGFYTNVGQG